MNKQTCHGKQSYCTYGRGGALYTPSGVSLGHSHAGVSLYEVRAGPVSRHQVVLLPVTAHSQKLTRRLSEACRGFAWGQSRKTYKAPIKPTTNTAQAGNIVTTSSAYKT